MIHTTTNRFDPYCFYSSDSLLYTRLDAIDLRHLRGWCWLSQGSPLHFGAGLHRELELMVGAGLTPMQVLLSATRNGAAVMGRGNELGRLQPGMLADLLVLIRIR